MKTTLYLATGTKGPEMSFNGAMAKTIANTIVFTAQGLIKP